MFAQNEVTSFESLPIGYVTNREPLNELGTYLLELGELTGRCNSSYTGTEMRNSITCLDIKRLIAGLQPS